VGLSAGRVLLDTNFLIDYWRGLPAAEALMGSLISDGAELVVNEVVICELVMGLRNSDRDAARRFLRPMEFVQPGPESAFEAGIWRASARAKGKVLSLADALIATAAVATGAAVLTRNERDFAMTPAAVETY
jgi:predicted nucleic acid-binding protein